MQKTIIALWGRRGSGKSTTIAYALAELLNHASHWTVERGHQRPGGPPEVWNAILTIDGVQVGITSPGDSAAGVTRRVTPLIEALCQVIVCATRTGGGSAAVLRALASQEKPPFEIKWIEKVSDTTDPERQDRVACDEIVGRVLEAVRSFQLVTV